MRSRTGRARQPKPPASSLRHSFAGRLGRLIEPVIAPLGFDWKIGIGIVTSFAAREVFVSTMSTVYNVGRTEPTPSSMTSLAQTLQAQRKPDGTPVYTPLTAVTLMVFYVFALQCVSTVAVVRRETNSWKWPFFQWFYMGALAWGLAFLTQWAAGCWAGREASGNEPRIRSRPDSPDVAAKKCEKRACVGLLARSYIAHAENGNDRSTSEHEFAAVISASRASRSSSC